MQKSVYYFYDIIFIEKTSRGDNVQYWWIWFIILFLCVIKPRKNKLYLGIINRKKKGRKRKGRKTTNIDK